MYCPPMAAVVVILQNTDPFGSGNVLGLKREKVFPAKSFKKKGSVKGKLNLRI
jgi:hypothetical protein